MAATSFFTLYCFLLLTAILSTSPSPSHAIKPPTSLHSLILGMTNSRTTIKIPKNSSSVKYVKTTTTLSEMVDMMEPLREVRDGYLISLSLGSPPQVIQLYMDTGSDLTWVPCGNLSFDCIQCDDYRNSTKLLSTFSPSYSSSSIRDSCSSLFCIDIHSSDNSYDPCIVSGCSLSTLLKTTCSRPCPSFAYTYGEGVVTGTLTRDTLKVHGSSQGGLLKEIPKFCFGCVGSTYREPMGIAGFGKGPLSLPSQLGFLQKGFSHCFLAFKYANNPNISSPLIVGDLAISSKDDHLQFTPMLNNPLYPNYYYIGLQSITIGSSTTAVVLPLSLMEFDSLGNGGMLIDSGTTYTHLPEPFYSQLISIIQTSIEYPRATAAEARTGFDLCYRIPCPNNNSTSMMDDDGFLPSITFNFVNNVSLVLPQGNNFYAMGAPNNSTVVKCLLFQSMESGGNGPAGVFGSFQQQNVQVVYDMEKARIGFQPMDCASASAAAFQGLHKT